MPVVAGSGRLCSGIVVTGGISERGVRATHGNIFPLAFRAAVIYRSQARAIQERLRANRSHTRGDRDRREVPATRERPILNARQLAVLAKRHRCEAGAIIERIIADAHDTRRDRDRGEAAAINDGSRADAYQLAILAKRHRR